MNNDIMNTLSTAAIFEGLSPVQLEMIATLCEKVTLHQGEVLFEEHDDSKDVYIIQQGGLEILMSPTIGGMGSMMGPVVITELREGQVVGEVALVDEGRRTATARATAERTMVLRIPQRKLLLLCETYPVLGFKLLKNVAVDLAIKIRNTDLTLRQYQLMLSSQQRLK